MQYQTRLIDADAVSEILGRPRASIYRLAREGLIPTVRLGRAVCFDREAIERFIEGGGKGLNEGGR